MAQIRVLTWTNANPAVALNFDVGFTVAEITVVDQTNGGAWYWNSGMTSGYYQTVSSGTITTSNGFTPLAQSGRYAAVVSGFTNANPGVITVDNTGALGFAAGDTIQVVDLADDGTATSLNGQYTVASITGTTITTGTNTSAYSVYVSGGQVRRISDTNSDPVATVNTALRGITIGTGAVGAASASMMAVVKGAESVV